MKIHIPFTDKKPSIDYTKESVDLAELSKEVSVAVNPEYSAKPESTRFRFRKVDLGIDYDNDLKPYVAQIKIYLPKIIFVLKALEQYYKYKTGSDPTAIAQVTNILSKILLTTKTLL